VGPRNRYLREATRTRTRPWYFLEEGRAPGSSRPRRRPLAFTSRLLALNLLRFCRTSVEMPALTLHSILRTLAKRRAIDLSCKLRVELDEALTEEQHVATLRASRHVRLPDVVAGRDRHEIIGRPFVLNAERAQKAAALGRAVSGATRHRTGSIAGLKSTKPTKLRGKEADHGKGRAGNGSHGGFGWE
jgi:hypothetical protein